jgi:hypothetical protein
MLNPNKQEDIKSNSSNNGAATNASKASKFINTLIYSLAIIFTYLVVTGHTATVHFVAGVVYALAAGVVGIFIPSSKKYIYVSCGFASAYVIFYVISKLML